MRMFIASTAIQKPKLAVAEMGIRPDDYSIQKRRYSCFYGTDLEILLKGLKAETLLLVGGLTDVCVRYTFRGWPSGRLLLPRH